MNTNKMTDKEIATYESIQEELDFAQDANDNKKFRYWMGKLDMFCEGMEDKYEFINNQHDIEDHIYGAPVPSMAGYCADLNRGLC
jgi:hypothetical protein